MTFICPYCFDKHKITETQFRCTNKKCKEFDDKEMTKYENGNVNNPLKGRKTFKAGISIIFRNYGNCPECGKQTFKVVCPSCHNILPPSTINGTNMIISIVGSRDTGKSHFVGVIIKELRERVLRFNGGAMYPEEDTEERYEAAFGRNLYTDFQRLEKTMSSLENRNNGAYRPLIYRYDVPHKKLALDIQHRNLIQENDTFTFVFFDTAGEDLDDEDMMSTVNKYICKSSGIIFLLDPMQIPEVRNKLDAKTIARATSATSLPKRADDIMARVSRLIRNDKNLPDGKKIDIPVAAVFSKFDAIYSIIPEGCTVLETSPHYTKKSFYLPDWHNVNSEVKGLLEEWNAGSFTSQLEANYTDYSYFAVSALGLGNSPREDGGIEKPRPHRIEDSFLWLLMKNGVIKSSQ